jgi:hypothetical protein
MATKLGALHEQPTDLHALGLHRLDTAQHRVAEHGGGRWRFGPKRVVLQPLDR